MFKFPNLALKNGVKGLAYSGPALKVNYSLAHSRNINIGQLKLVENRAMHTKHKVGQDTIPDHKAIQDIEMKLTDKMSVISKESEFCGSDLKNNSNDTKIDNTNTKTEQRNFKKDFMEITKFRLSILNSLVSVSTYCFYAPLPINYIFLGSFVTGTICISMTTQVMNQIKEKNFDAEMKRTFNRPLPKNRFTKKEAYFISASLYFSSILMYSQLPFYISTILVSNSILFLYIFVYTPLKRVNNLSMHVGAVVGALPAILGSVAALNGIPSEALLLASYIFFWQYPHFYGILYPNRADYKNAGFKFIASDHTKDSIAFKQIIVGMIGMLISVYLLYENGIISDPAFIAFLAFYCYKIPAVSKFLQNPVVYGKLIRIRSYSPFLIVLISFLHAAMSKSMKIDK